MRKFVSLISTRNRNCLGLVCAILVALLALVSCVGPAPEPTPTTTPPPTSTVKLVSPVVNLSANVSVLSQTESSLSIEARLVNPNSVAINISDIEVTARGGAGQTFVQGKVPGGAIPPSSEMTFVNSLIAPLEMLRETKILVTADSRAEAAGTTLPFSTTTTINLAAPSTLVNTPQVTLRASIKGLTANSELNTQVEVYFSNPNPIRLDVGDLNVSVRGKQASDLETSLMAGGSIAPNSDGVFTSDIVLPITAVDEQDLKFTIKAVAAFAFITFPISTTATVQVPGLDTLINVPQPTIDFKYDWVTATQIPPLQIEYEASIENTNGFVLKLGGRRLSAYGPDGTLLKEGSLGETTIQPLSTLKWSDSILLSEEVRKLFGSEITIKLDMEIGPEGTNTAVPLGASKVILVKTSYN